MKETKKLLRNKIKTSKGITLVALVITIIILLILATVTILALTGENGLFSRAKEARTETQIKSEEEQIKLEVMASWDPETGTLNGGGLETKLRNIGATVSGSSFPMTVTYGSGNSYEVASDGTVTKTNGGGGGGNTISAGETATGGNKDYVQGGKTAVIPENWTVSKVDGETTINNGLVIYDLNGATLSDSDWTADTNNNSILDVQENYNQFVWVPVSKENFATEFVREHFGTASQKLWSGNFVTDAPSANNMYEPTPSSTSGTTQTTATEVTSMYNSVQQNGGFYIARYEAGTTETSGSGIRGTLVSKKGATVYNNIGWSNQRDMTTETGGAVEVSRGMYSGHSTLCYGVQWDAVMRWISNDNTLSGCLTNSTGKGNYSDVSNYNTIPTGSNSNYQMKNIYDMAGNVYELTMEACDTDRRVLRGGDYYYIGSKVPVSSRIASYPDYSSGNIGFRAALFV